MNNRILYIPKEKKQFGQKKKNYRLRFIAGIIVCLGIIAGGIAATHIHGFQIQKISINGLEATPENNVRQVVASVLAGSYAAGLIPRGFLLAAPTQQIIDRIKNQFPLIADIEVKKEFPDKLAMVIQERKLFGVLCNDSTTENAVVQVEREIQCFYLDTNGITYQKAPETHGFLIMRVSTDNPEITLGGQAVDMIAMRRMIDLTQKLPPILGSQVVSYQIRHAASHELRAVSKVGFSLLIKQDDDMNAMLSVLKTVLEKEIGSKRKNLDYIDLRFGNKVFYKFR